MCTMVLKETISYYVNNQSSVFCTFLDASKAFDRVNYGKLFRLLIRRDLPPCIIRILINLYTISQVRVMWAGLASDFFPALNGVKQGAVISPVLFCIYIDDLLIKLSSSGVGCYIGLSFVGALAYADDIVLIAPTPSAMRKLLAICDDYAKEFNIIFNADKSNFIVVAARKRRHLYNDMCAYKFYIGGKIVANVEQYTHLGHIITSSFTDKDDIIYRRNCFIGQANNVLCFFSKLDVLVRLRLFKSYCSSMYGCELWSLADSNSVNYFCCAWRKALRRIFYLPPNTHSNILPIISDTLPIFDELCKRTSRFITACLNARSSLVRFVSFHSVSFSKYRSPLGSNALLVCKHFSWSSDSFISNCIDLCNYSFKDWCGRQLSDDAVKTALFLLELIFVREGRFSVNDFSQKELTDIINCVATM